MIRRVFFRDFTFVQMIEIILKYNYYWFDDLQTNLEK